MREIMRFTEIGVFIVVVVIFSSLWHRCAVSRCFGRTSVRRADLFLGVTREVDVEKAAISALKVREIALK